MRKFLHSTSYEGANVPIADLAQTCYYRYITNRAPVSVMESVERVFASALRRSDVRDHHSLTVADE